MTSPVKLTRRHVDFAASLASLDTPTRCSPKTAEALISHGYVYATAKQLYRLTARGKQWVKGQSVDTSSKPKRASPFSNLKRKGKNHD